MKYCIAIFMLTCALLFANEPDDFLHIEAISSLEQATVGQVIEYKVSITGESLKDVKIVVPEKQEVFPSKEEDETKTKDVDSIVPIYIIDSVKKNDSSDDKKQTITITMTISFYRVGSWFLPEIDITGDDGIKAGYNIPTVSITALNPNFEFQEAEAPLDAKRNYFRLAILIIAILALAFFIVRWLLKREKKPVVETIDEKPIDVFMRELDLLNGPTLIEQGKIDEYTFGVSEIFRRFLSSRFSFDAAEMTSSELQRYMDKILRTPKYMEIINDVADLLNLWDLAKFAEFMPAKETMLQSHEKIIKTAKRLAW